MSRKHENFAYCRKGNGEWYDASQYTFYFNNKVISLDYNMQSDLAYLCVQGKKKEAEDELKRILRKQEKQKIKFVTYGFNLEDNPKEYVWSPSPWMAARIDNIQDRLRVYKRMKHDFFVKNEGYYIEHNVIVEQGSFNPFGKNNSEKIENKRKLNGNIFTLKVIL